MNLAEFKQITGFDSPSQYADGNKSIAMLPAACVNGEMKTAKYRRGQKVFAKIIGHWFKATVRSHDRDTVIVKLPADCDRELNASDVEPR